VLAGKPLFVFYFNQGGNMSSIKCRTVEVESCGESYAVDSLFMNYGNVVGLHAVREHAIHEAYKRALSYAVIKVEMTDGESMVEPRTFSVAIEPKAEVLNPRLDTDKVSVKKPRSLSNIWGLL
jgi:hypothetical protein